MTRAAIYVRVSTDIQADGYSIDEQLERLRKFCDAKDWIIFREYIDPGYSGSNIDRPAMLQLLKDAREKNIDLVLVYKLDRLSRSQKDTLYLIEEEFLPNGVDFISMTENFDTSTPFGKAMIGILSVFAQLERENIKMRLAMGHVGRAKAGYWRGGGNPPIGYDFIDGMLQVNNYESIQVKKIYDLFLSGESMNSIAKYMHDHYTNRYASYEHTAVISKILRNRIYIGKIIYKGMEYQGIHEPIVSLDVFDRAQKRYMEISNNKNHHYKSPYKGNHLLTGMMFCGSCGARYFTWTARARDKDGKQKKIGEKYSYYKCYSRDKNSKMKKSDTCINPTYKVEVVDNMVISEIKKIMCEKDYLEKLHEVRPNPLPDPETGILKKTLEEVSDQINKLMDLYSLGTIPIEDIASRIKPLYEKKEKIERELQKVNTLSEIDNRISLEETRAMLKNVKDIDKIGLEEQRNIVQALIRRVEFGSEKMDIKIIWKFN